MCRRTIWGLLHIRVLGVRIAVECVFDVRFSESKVYSTLTVGGTARIQNTSLINP
jgi:hypothetical protein